MKTFAKLCLIKLGLAIFLMNHAVPDEAYSQALVTQEQVVKLKNTVVEIKAEIDTIIAQAQNPRLNNEDLNEDDALAIPRLLQASSNLFEAGTRADETLLEILAGNFQLAFYRFSQACTATGLARSQVSRARFGALVPPAGFVSIFDAQFANIIIELGLLRSPFPTGVGCP
ncbi:MAG: hypothetical protein ACOH5I_16060 [Oligoflexus sp.]